MEIAPKGQLVWRCRRGTKELDRILSNYLHTEYEQASQDMQLAFAELLEHQDPDIYDWLMGVSGSDERRIRKIVTHLQTLMTSY